jgi:hypothetical protein
VTETERSREARRVVGYLAGLAILGGLAVAHILITDRGDDYTGPLLPLDHAYSLALVLGLFAIAAGVGIRLLKATGLDLGGAWGAWELLLFATAVGLGVLATATFVLGLLAGMRPVPLLGLLAGAAFLARHELRELPPLVRDAWSSFRTSGDRFSRTVFLVVAVFLVTRALAPPTDWDVLMYHLRIPQQFLAAGAIYVPEDNAHFGFVGLPHMLYIPLLALGSPAAPALVSALCTLGIALTGLAFGLRFLDPRTAAFNLAVVWGSTILILVGVTARVDTILAFYLFLVHYAVVRADQSHDPRFLYLAAALAGMAVGVKYNALVYLLVLAPLGLVVVATRLRHRTAAVGLTLGLALVTALPWLLKNGLFLGDPLYPFLGGRRLDPWVARLYAGHALPAALEPAAFAKVWGLSQRFDLVDFFLAPGRITLEEEGGLYYPNLLLLLVPLWLWFRKDKVLGWLAGPALAYAVLIVLFAPNASLRYLIPAIAPLTIVALECYARTSDKLLSPTRVHVLLRATMLVVLAGSVSVLYRDVTRGRHLAYLLGFVSRRALLPEDYADVVSFVNGRLPQQSRTLMLFDARGYYFRVPVLQDDVVMNWPLLSAHAAARDCLRPAGITHVLLNRNTLQYYERRGFDPAALRLDAFEGFAQECLSPIYSRSGFTVFQVHAPAGGRPSTR